MNSGRIIVTSKLNCLLFDLKMTHHFFFTLDRFSLSNTIPQAGATRRKGGLMAYVPKGRSLSPSQANQLTARINDDFDIIIKVIIS